MQDDNYKPHYLDRKQCPAKLDEVKYNRPKFAPGSRVQGKIQVWGTLDLPEHLENSEYD